MISYDPRRSSRSASTSSSSVCAYSRIIASGVRSSCEAALTNCERIWATDCSRRTSRTSSTTPSPSTPDTSNVIAPCRITGSHRAAPRASAAGTHTRQGASAPSADATTPGGGAAGASTMIRAPAGSPNRRATSGSACDSTQVTSGTSTARIAPASLPTAA